MIKNILTFLTLLFFMTSCTSKSWRDASRKSAGIAPKASEITEDIFQIYYARAYSWRGYFGIHPWVAWKEQKDSQYTVAQVTSWNLRRSKKSSVSVVQDLPDRLWFDSVPTLLTELRGKQAKEVIVQAKKLIQDYPFQDSYRVWPGPNSNTFVAYLIREIDQLQLELPANAVGKDYLGASDFFAASPSGTGFQFSAFGLLGLTLGLGEGVELNFLGANIGLDFWTPALKMPIFGRLGFDDQPIP